MKVSSGGNRGSCIVSMLDVLLFHYNERSYQNHARIGS
jgi:hypothetical protein